MRRLPRDFRWCDDPSCDSCFYDAPDPEKPIEAPAEARDIEHWTTSAGVKLRIVDMSDGHVTATLVMLKRRRGAREYMIPVFEAEQRRRRIAKRRGRLQFEPDGSVVAESANGNIRVKMTPTSGAESVTVERREPELTAEDKAVRERAKRPSVIAWDPEPEPNAALTIEAVMPPKGIPVDDILPMLREQVLQHQLETRK